MTTDETATIQDLQKAVWEAYEKATRSVDYCGKSAEGIIEVQFKAFHNAESYEDFITPEVIGVYSYALGPSRMHRFVKAKRLKRIDCATWETPTPITTALIEVNQWIKEFMQGEDL